MEKLPWINHFHKTHDREWLETDVVLRVSLGNFLFFSILSIMMIGVKTQDPRDGIHHGGWLMKIISWCILVIFMFFLPNEIINFYESMSTFGAGFFLLVQVVLLLDFVHGWNDTWVGYDEQFWLVKYISQELAGVAAAAEGLAFEENTMERLCACSRVVSHFPTTDKEFKWRNGWFYSLLEKAIRVET